MPGGDERVGDLRTSDAVACPVRRGCEEAVCVDSKTQRRETIGDLPDAADPIGALSLEKPGERMTGGIDEVREHVHIASLFDRGDFDAAHKPEPVLARGLARLRETREGVVICHADRPEADLRGTRDERSRRQQAVRGGGPTRS